mmetsp:Transcript_2529/g.4898  ORF Transcript_2529/g.4898 Transcript_2529/m.4898 type:complete len:266 (-) Transcript_2529:570-1367(-)
MLSCIDKLASDVLWLYNSSSKTKSCQTLAYQSSQSSLVSAVDFLTAAIGLDAVRRWASRSRASWRFLAAASFLSSEEALVDELAPIFVGGFNSFAGLFVDNALPHSPSSPKSSPRSSSFESPQPEGEGGVVFAGIIGVGEGCMGIEEMDIPDGWDCFGSEEAVVPNEEGGGAAGEALLLSPPFVQLFAKEPTAQPAAAEKYFEPAAVVEFAVSAAVLVSDPIFALPAAPVPGLISPERRISKSLSLFASSSFFCCSAAFTDRSRS